MCAPMLGILGSALSMVASVASAQAADNAAEADYQAKVVAWRQNIVNAQTAARDEQRQIITRQMEEQSKTVQKKHVSYVEEAQKQAEATVSAAGAGVQGISVDNLLTDIGNKSAANRAYMDENYRYIVADTTEQLKSTRTKLAMRVDSMPTPLPPQKTAGIAALGAGAKMIGSFGGGGGG
jgi:hypothetical protein